MEKKELKISDLLNLEKSNLINLNNIKLSHLDKIKKERILKTDCVNLNKILGGGFFPKRGYLIFGSGKTGKTQLMHQLCVNFLSDQKKTNEKRKVIYFDTEATFRPERISEMASLRNIHPESIIKHIIISEILSNSALFLSLEKLEVKIQKDPHLLIIDSLNNHFRSESSSKLVSYKKSKDIFLKILELLFEYLNKYNIFLICTAQITESFLENKILSEIPVGNQFINNYFTEYLYFKKKEEMNEINKYFAHLVDSLFLPEKRVMFQIDKRGVQDYKI